MVNTEKLRLDLPVVLPEVKDLRDRCIERLIATLQGKPGIFEAHVREGGGVPQLCVHYDPNEISLNRVREIACATGAHITDEIGHLLFLVDPMHAREARLVSTRLRELPGVLEADAGVGGVLRVEFDRKATGEEALRNAIAGLGIALPAPRPEHAAGRHEDHDHAAHDHAGQSTASTGTTMRMAASSANAPS